MRRFVIAVFFFFVGLGVGVIGLRQFAPQPVSPAAEATDQVVTQTAVNLSPTTVSVLHRITTPVEIRFYTMWKKSHGTARLEQFSGRIDQLLAEYHAVAGDRLVIRKIDNSNGPSGESAAQADGITALHRSSDKLEWFGITVAADGQKAVMARLNPDWQDAFEFDLSRAIAQVSGQGAAAAVVVNPAPSDEATVTALLQSMPELPELTQAERVLKVQNAARTEFATAAKNFVAEIDAAKNNLAAARAGGNQAQIDAALAELNQLQNSQAERLGELSQTFRAQLAALDHIDERRQ